MSTRLERYVPVAQLFAARLILFHQTIARRLGLNATDLKCLRLISLRRGMTAADVAREAGLKPPSVSVMLDRLQARGFIRRKQDPHDRRRVILETVPEAMRHADELYRSQGKAMRDFLKRYSEEEFALILNFMNEVGEIAHNTMRGLNSE